MKTIGKIGAFLLLSVYVLSMAGSACTALSCRCTHAAAAACLHHCAEASCCHHGHAADLCMAQAVAAESAQLGGECCRHNHSTQTQLYTADTDRDWQVRAAAPGGDALAAAGDCALQPLSGSDTYRNDGGSRPLTAPGRSSTALRAPPAYV